MAFDVVTYRKEWYRKNKAKSNAASKQWREKNRDKHRATSKAWQEANPERVRAAKRAWKCKNRERLRLDGESERKAVKAAAFALFGSVCQRCGFSDQRALQIDHIYQAEVPQGHKLRGGEGLYRAIVSGRRAIEDLQLLCANCNWIKRVENGECER